MRRPINTKLFFLFLTLQLILGCGRGINTTKVDFNPNAILAPERNLTADETNIATRICYAYLNKSQNFRTTEFYGKTFNFSANSIDCQGISATYNVSAVLGSDNVNQLSYNPGSGFNTQLKFNSKVQTDTSGYLAQLCPKVLTNKVVTNTSTQNNVKAQIAFFRDTSDNTDVYLIQYFILQTNNTYAIDSAEKFKTPTENVSTSTRITGMDQYYSTQKICPNKQFDKRPNSEFIQTFISR